MIDAVNPVALGRHRLQLHHVWMGHVCELPSPVLFTDALWGAGDFGERSIVVVFLTAPVGASNPKPRAWGTETRSFALSVYSAGAVKNLTKRTGTCPGAPSLLSGLLALSLCCVES